MQQLLRYPRIYQSYRGKCQQKNAVSGQSLDSLHAFAMLVRRVTLRLTAPFRVSLDGTEICHLHHDAVEGPSETRREWIVCPREREAPSASISRTEAGRRAE